MWQRGELKPYVFEEGPFIAEPVGDLGQMVGAPIFDRRTFRYRVGALKRVLLFQVLSSQKRWAISDFGSSFDFRLF